jgi:predicted amidophosphoribosyltransferase
MNRAAPFPVPPSFARGQALLAYEGAAREVVAQLKYRNVRSPVGWLAIGIAGLVHPGEVEVVTWAPTTDLRRRRRGFDQAEVLARHVARELSVPCRSLVARAPGPPQTGRTLVERSRGPAFVPTRRLAGIRVAVVDDVVTTGATMDAVGRALRAAGATHLVGLAAAHPA